MIGLNHSVPASHDREGPLAVGLYLWEHNGEWNSQLCYSRISPGIKAAHNIGLISGLRPHHSHLEVGTGLL